MTGEVQVEIRPVPVQQDAYLAVIEKVALSPDLDVEKLERILALQERLFQHRAKTAFDAAMSAAQAEMRRVAADSDNPQTHSRYASYGAIDRALRPVYTKHGFALSFNTEPVSADVVRVLCEVSHLGGYSKHYQIDMPADGKGAKGGDVMTKTHASGSAVTYGMRYLLKMIFNVAIGKDDDDGNGGKAEQPAAPKDFERWADDFLATADNGRKGLDEFWAATANSNRALTDYAAKCRKDLIAEGKRRAAAADKGVARG